MSFRSLSAAATSGLTALLAACWTVPNANLQPAGPPRVIQNGIIIAGVRDRQIVQAVDVPTRLMIVSGPDEAGSRAYKVAPAAAALSQIKTGDEVRLRTVEELTVYVPVRDEREQDINPREDARVLDVDRSYRVLRLEYRSGRIESVKVGLNVRMRDMAPGDSVSIRPIEVTCIQLQAH